MVEPIDPGAEIAPSQEPGTVTPLSLLSPVVVRCRCGAPVTPLKTVLTESMREVFGGECPQCGEYLTADVRVESWSGEEGARTVLVEVPRIDASAVERRLARLIEYVSAARAWDDVRSDYVVMTDSSLRRRYLDRLARADEALLPTDLKIPGPGADDAPAQESPTRG